MPVFNIYAVPIMDGAFASTYRILDENPRLNSVPAVIAARATAEDARKNVHRAAETVRNVSGFFKSTRARYELRQAGYAAKLALDALLATADKNDAAYTTQEHMARLGSADTSLDEILAQDELKSPQRATNLKTTVLFTGLATSFFRDGLFYVVSTLHRKELGGFYQTSVLKYSSSGGKGMVYRIEVMSQLQSAQEHVDTVRMALSEDEHDWEGTKAYQDEVMNASSSSDRRNDRPQEMSWTDKRIRDVVAAADINYKPGLFARFFLS
jgi:hypothetical protein